MMIYFCLNLMIVLYFHIEGFVLKELLELSSRVEQTTIAAVMTSWKQCLGE